ncbi:hypothetical protein M514_02408 [Trichuris suis]|uniref:Uncharacterized protein n=1 Tax=Trichuris suis TaxID=68888 RepID=A0A085MHN5_9BILA|nr:hypothetical protein M513_02408 [Trichuris suis]KFD64815.1 hypothetical protein M514_02408 [Trichuris suis]
MDRIVTNLGSVTLSDTQHQVLSKGRNFVPTPKQVPPLDIIASVEHSLTSLERSKAAEIRGAITTPLSHRATKCSSTLTITERQELKDHKH